MGRKKRRMRPIIMRRPPKQKSPSQMSNKELRDKIYALEYDRAVLQKNKFPNMRKAIREENLTIQIKVYRTELEKREKKNGDKVNSKS